MVALAKAGERVHWQAAWVQLGDLQLDAVGAGVLSAVTVAVVAVDPLGALRVIAGAALGLHVELHESLGHELQRLAQTSTSGTFLASSENAVVGLVVVCSFSRIK